jgi:hypothetical protein
MFAYSGGSGVAADEAERDAQMAKWGRRFGHRVRRRGPQAQPDPVPLVILDLRGGAALPRGRRSPNHRPPDEPIVRRRRPLDT